MEDKENMCKRPVKRRSSAFDVSLIISKRQSIETNDFIDFNNENEDFYQSSAKKPMITKSCLTDNFKSRCNLDNVKENCDTPPCFGTPEEQIIPLGHFNNLPVTPRMDEILLTNDNNVPCQGTPEDQIIPFAEFRKLPRPIINSSDDNKSHIGFNLNKSITETNINHSNNILDNSFEFLKAGLYKAQTFTPLKMNFNPTFLTPETPCDINEIDVDKQSANLVQLPCLNPMVRLKGRRSLAQCSISPMFYENVPKPRKKEKKRVQRTYDKDQIKPSMDSIDNCKIEEILAEQVVQIIDNDFTSDSSAYHIIDCRYPYEYEGGHICGAVNLYTPWQMLNYIFMSNYDLETLKQPLDTPEESLEELLDKIVNIEKPHSNWKYQAYIFHCEFSSIRGPEMARCLRNVDRLANLSCYPDLFFPKVYIMKKGYNEFYKKFKRYCIPSNYVRMDIKDPTNKNYDSDNELNDSIEESSNGEIIDEDTRKHQIKEYNYCKREAQEQMKLLSQIMKD